MKILNSINTTERYKNRILKKKKRYIKPETHCKKVSKTVQCVSNVLGVIIAGAIVLGQLTKKDTDENGIPDVVETITDKFSKDQYKEMSNFNPVKPIAIWGGTNKELMTFYSQQHIYDQEFKNTMRHIVALAHVTKEYKYPTIAKCIGYCKEIMDACKLDFDKTDLKNNEVGINYVKNNPTCSDDDILQYAYQYAQTEEQSKNDK